MTKFYIEELAEEYIGSKEIILRENPICAKCGQKGRGFKKEGFAVLFPMDSLEKLESDGICQECAKHEAKIKATARQKAGVSKKWWKK